MADRLVRQSPIGRLPINYFDAGLAAEIGLNECIALAQIEYWVSESAHIIDGTPWVCKSIREMHEDAFPFWSISTIQRTVKNLLSKGYIVEGNFNKTTYHRTRWFTLGPAVNKLKSVSLSDANN